jgi:hypothetical protein
MPKNIITDTTDFGICWFKTLVLKTKNNYFKFIKLFNFESQIYFLDYMFFNDFIIIFILYYISKIIQ